MSEDKNFLLQIVTPLRTVFSGQVESLIVPAHEGFLGVMAHHSPLVALLKPGPIWVRKSERPGLPAGAGEEIVSSRKEEVFACSGGILEVRENVATLLVDAVERAEDIDIPRAERAFQRARERLKSRDPSIDRERAERAYLRALTRLKVAKKEVFRFEE